jgi:alpha-glucosidase
MARLNWGHLLVAASSLVNAQSSTSQSADGLTATYGGSSTTASPTVGTATINGTATTYSVQFTVPASADVGPNLLPNIKGTQMIQSLRLPPDADTAVPQDPNAKQAQALCPGYKASDVKYTVRETTRCLEAYIMLIVGSH